MRLKQTWTIFLGISLCTSLLFIISYTLSTPDEDPFAYGESSKYFKSKNLIVVGTVKDAATTLPSTLPILDRLTHHFNRTKFIIFESNSKDNTLDILLGWKGSDDHKVILHGDELVSDAFGTRREDKLTEYRNLLLRHAQKHMPSDGDAVLMSIDLDIQSTVNPWDFILHEVFVGVAREGNDLVCLNAVIPETGAMRDTYAIVDTNNVWFKAFIYEMRRASTLSYLPKRIRYLWWKYNSVIERRHTVGQQPQRLAWRLISFATELWSPRFVDVKSCFGGLAFYTSLQRITESRCKYVHWAEMMAMAEPNDYDAALVLHQFRRDPNIALDRDKTCEHIPFNLCLYNHGMKAAISRHSELLFE